VGEVATVKQSVRRNSHNYGIECEEYFVTIQLIVSLMGNQWPFEPRPTVFAAMPACFVCQFKSDDSTMVPL